LTNAELRSLALAILAAFVAMLLLSSCETTSTTSRTLPAYEAPIAKGDFQHVRTTAYTHTEADHTQYGARNALGGELHAAGPAVRRAEYSPGAIVIAEVDAVRKSSDSSSSLQPFSMDGPSRTGTRTTIKTTITTTRTTTKSMRGAKRAVAVAKPPKIGSAAADWSRWPVGTTFRLLSTGQIYRVEDYGWALSGRNTIDLYMANRRDMNAWGARQEPIQILHWGDSQQSLQFLQSHQNYKHIKRMVLELQGQDQAAAALQ
jgi:3D (Asp-Asp-Asp) domain-containing protein